MNRVDFKPVSEHLSSGYMMSTDVFCNDIFVHVAV